MWSSRLATSAGSHRVPSSRRTSNAHDPAPLEHRGTPHSVDTPLADTVTDVVVITGTDGLNATAPPGSSNVTTVPSRHAPRSTQYRDRA
jgi:hypothetical protein